MPTKRSREVTLLFLYITTTFIIKTSNIVLAQTPVSNSVVEGKQIIQDLYNNFTTTSSILPSSSSSSPSPPTSNPVDLIFVLDRSASVTTSGWQSVLRFVQSFLEHFTVDSDNTRVAVVSYGTTASVDIDDVKSGDFNKCALVSRLQRQMSKKVPAGYSATHDAILRAMDVALGSRTHSKKAVIVITDGKSNIGPPPVRASVQLRSLVWDSAWDVGRDGPQLQVYAFGIKDAYMPEVRTIASSLPNHTFYIPSFESFAELARSLHDDSQSESWHVLSEKEPCLGLCDDNAYCTCGTRSGNYLCVCKDGYHGDGTQCTACPRGTYKARISPSRCVPCPTNSTTLAAGATDIKQCVCQPPLYQDESGQPCEIRYCDNLPDINHGKKFNVIGRVVDELPDSGQPCTNMPDTSCHYQCDQGYRLDGHPGLVCLPNGSWAGSVPSCQIVDCGPLSYHQQETEHATTSYINETTTYSSAVHVQCHKGWRVFGDSERVCTQYGTWSGTRAWCVENKCPALPLSPGLIISPAPCGRAAQLPDMRCMFQCEQGYERSGPATVTCTQHGTWDSDIPVACVDIEPPIITCPEDIRMPVTTANFAVIHWKSFPPLADDNSGDFTVTALADSPLRLTAGFHQIKYIARDKAGNEAFCVQGITILDFLVHVVTCPTEDFVIYMKKHQEDVVWPEVSFADQNNETVSHTCTPANNSMLPAGVYEVSCVPNTRSYQQARCQFRARLEQPLCEAPPPPLHGSVSCSPTPTSLLTCVPHCNNNYDFHYQPQGAYICDLNGNWRLRNEQQFWPDCSRKYYPHRATLSGKARYFYYSGKCQDVKAEIAAKFTSLLEEEAWQLCGDHTCSIENVDVQCGTESKKRRRRSVKSDQKFLPQSDSPIKTSSSLHGLGKETNTVSPFQQISPLQESNQATSGLKFVKKVKKVFRPEQNTRTKRSDGKEYSDYDMNTRDKSLDKLDGIVPENINQSNDYTTAMMKKDAFKNESVMIPKKETSNNTNEVVTRNLYYMDEDEFAKRKLYNHTLHTEVTQDAQVNSNPSTSENQHEECVGCYTEDPYFTHAVDRTFYPIHSNIQESPVDTANAQDDNFLQIDKRNDVMMSHNNETGSVNFQDELTQQVFSKLQENLKPTNESGSADFYSAASYNENKDDYVDEYYDETLQNATEYNAEMKISMLNGSSNSSSTDFFHNVDKKNNDHVIKIKFLIVTEDSEKDFDLNKQANMLDRLMSIYARLDELLPTQQLILGESNASSHSNDTMGVSSDVLYPDQYTLDFPNMTCDSGYVTKTGFFGHQTCVACPSGSYYDKRDDQCLSCLIGLYQPDEAQSTCELCPPNTMTESLGAYNISMCLAMCPPGEFSGSGLAPCLPCPLHTYQPIPSAATCIPCPWEKKTLGMGAVHSTECLDLCEAGSYSETGLVPCRLCAQGYYQPDVGASECLMCDEGMTTEIEGATNSTDCIEWDPCTGGNLTCHEGGQCAVLNNAATCVCFAGFTGVLCETDLPDCEESSCLNNGTCIDGINNFTCMCEPGFTGHTCEVDIDECISTPCRNGGSCLDKINGFVCYCLNGFTGSECETELHLCADNVCVHGLCEVTEDGTAKCICDHGYAGPSCNTTYDLCSSHPCVNSEECTSTPGHFMCHCLPGYTGDTCDTYLDPCQASPCREGSTCIPTKSYQHGYLCKCQGGWTGAYCDQEVSADFDLVFINNSPDGQYVVIPPEFIPSLANFSTCAWLRPLPLSAFSTIMTFTVPGPMLTFQGNDYIVDDSDVDFHVVFALRHTDKLIVHVLDESIVTNITLTPYVWSHLCVTWSSRVGQWQVMVNGSLTLHGNTGRTLPALSQHASVVLGQQNPYHAEATTLWDVYVGEMSQFNIFSKVLSLNDVQRLANDTECNKTFGDVISWTDVVMYRKGDLILRENSNCLDVNECWFPNEYPCGKNRACTDLIGSYNCSDCMYGYTGEDCSEPDDECELDVCEHGDCFDGPEPYDFRCVCPASYTGLHCEVMINHCKSSPCQNGGTCLPQENSFTCQCPMQHMGPFCERPASACLPNPCQNQGICHEKQNDLYECNCPEDFKGRLCEERRIWCEGNVCRNGGTCVNTTSMLHENVVARTESEYFCKCQDGWMGRQCDVKMILSCDLSPCVNGGSCIPLSDGGYECQCPEIPGANLDENCEFLSPCSSSPCPNNTVCVLLSGHSFICLCVNGRDCEPWTQEHLANTTKSTFPDGLTTEKMMSTRGMILTSEWILALIGVAVVVVIISVLCIVYIVKRQKHKRFRENILNNISDVPRGHLTNPAFHSEELQLEESTYAELGDGYTLPQDGDTAGDHGSRQSSQRSIKSTNLQRAVSRKMSPTSSGSFASVHSSLSKKGAVDDTQEPLISDDYLEPMQHHKTPTAPERATANDSKFIEEVDKDTKSLLPRLGHTNAGFCPDNYIIPEQKRNPDILRDQKDSIKKGYRASYVYDDGTSVHYINMGQKPNTDMSSNIQPVNTVPRQDNDCKSLPNKGYVNTQLVDNEETVPDTKFAKGQGNLPNPGLHIVHNPGYVPVGTLPAQRMYVNENKDISHCYLDNLGVPIPHHPQHPVAPVRHDLAHGKSYVPFFDVWNLKPNGGSAFKTDELKDSIGSQHLLHREASQSLPRLTTFEHSPQNPYPYFSGSQPTSPNHRPDMLTKEANPVRKPIFDPSFVEKLRSGQKLEQGTLPRNSHLANTKTFSPNFVSHPHLSDFKSGADASAEEGSAGTYSQPYLYTGQLPTIRFEDHPTEFIPEYLELLPSDKLKLSLFKVTKPRHPQRPLSLPSQTVPGPSSNISPTQMIPKAKSSAPNKERIISQASRLGLSSSMHSLPSQTQETKYSPLPGMPQKEAHIKTFPSTSVPYNSDMSSAKANVILEDFCQKQLPAELPKGKGKPRTKKDKIILEDFSKKKVNRGGNIHGQVSVELPQSSNSQKSTPSSDKGRLARQEGEVSVTNPKNQETTPEKTQPVKQSNDPIQNVQSRKLPPIPKPQ